MESTETTQETQETQAAQEEITFAPITPTEADTGNEEAPGDTFPAFLTTPRPSFWPDNF